MRRNSSTLGFLPREALRSFFEKGGVMGAKDSHGELAGYILYTAYQEYFRITQLCVSEEARGKGIAKRLVEKLKSIATTQKAINLNCRRDFPAYNMWEKLGFVPLYDKPGRAAEGSTLTVWRLPLAPESQLDLFRAKTSDEALDVIIDAHIFFDLHEPDNATTKISKALLSDFLIDSLNLQVTDELLVEINRKRDSAQRAISKQKASRFQEAEYNPQLSRYFEEILNGFLPSDTRSQQSDIRHLAKAAASDANIFVTRDQVLLNKSNKISRSTNLQVLSPIDLIIRLHELYNQQSYVSTHVSGVNLIWCRLNEENITNFPYTSFLENAENQGRFKEKLNPFLVSPNRYECEILKSDGDIVAFRVLEKSNDSKTLTVHLSRVASSNNYSLFERFLVTDTVGKAVANNLDMVKFETASISDKLIPYLFDIGFTKHSGSYIRFCFSQCLSQQQVLSGIAKLCPKSRSSYQGMSDINLEKSCSPLALGLANQKYFLMPIRPGYAISLVDRHQASHDLFGGEPDVLLRWDNVYYRRKSQHKMLSAPARILWYVSGEEGQIVAVSCLDDVVIDTPKPLFKRFKKFGILSWEELYEMSGGDVSKEIMALKFSHTFSFRNPIPLDVVRFVFSKAGKKLLLQAPSKIPEKIFHELFRLGYPNPT